MPTFFLKPCGFLFGSWVQQIHPLFSCITAKEGKKSCVMYEPDSSGILRKPELKEIIL